MECPHCKNDFEIEDAEITTEIANTGQQSIDLQVECPECEELAYYTFVNVADLTKSD